MKLTELSIGQMATITSVGGEGALRQHFLDMGLIPGVDVSLVKFAPMGDPMELRISTYTLTIRLADAEKIEIKDPRPAKTSVYRQQKRKRIFLILVWVNNMVRMIIRWNIKGMKSIKEN